MQIIFPKYWHNFEQEFSTHGSVYREEFFEPHQKIARFIKIC